MVVIMEIMPVHRHLLQLGGLVTFLQQLEEHHQLGGLMVMELVVAVLIVAVLAAP